MAKRVVVSSAPLWDPVYLARFRRRSGWRGPVPAFNNRRRVAAWRADYFFDSGRRCHDDLVPRLQQATGRDLGSLDVLDLACGPGRIAMHFEGTFRSFTVSDVDHSAIDYMRENFPSLTVVLNQSRPPLPFADDSFDAVYSWSLWTHLPLELQMSYLADLRRILRPGGVALLTTNGHAFLDEYQAYPRAEQWWLGVTHDDLRGRGMIYHEYDFIDNDRTHALTGVTASFGLTCHDPAWIRTHWADRFHIDAIEEGAMSNNQDLVVLRLP